MHIAYSPYCSNICKSSPYFVLFSYFCFPLLWPWCINYAWCLTRRPTGRSWTSRLSFGSLLWQYSVLTQRFSTYSDSRTTWQILSRFADHQKISTFSRESFWISDDLFKSFFLNFFSIRGPPKRISPIFTISLHFSGSRTEKRHSNTHLQSIVVTFKKVQSLSSQFRQKPTLKAVLSIFAQFFKFSHRNSFIVIHSS